MEEEIMNPIVPGRWYFCLPCKNCEQLIPYAECEPDALVGGNLDLGLGLIPCPYCTATHSYKLGEIERHQAEPSDEPNLPIQ
jgi:hypothetical protein